MNKGEQGGKTGYKDFSTDILIHKILSTANSVRGFNAVVVEKLFDSLQSNYTNIYNESMKRVLPEKMLDLRRNKTGFFQERKLFSSFEFV